MCPVCANAMRRVWRAILQKRKCSCGVFFFTRDKRCGLRGPPVRRGIPRLYVGACLRVAVVGELGSVNSNLEQHAHQDHMVRITRVTVPR